MWSKGADHFFINEVFRTRSVGMGLCFYYGAGMAMKIVTGGKDCGYDTTATTSAKPIFSIIIPVYNVAPYLRECLDSVCAQTLTDWECICVDDGSTDSSPAILDEYAAKDKRIKILKQENAGSGYARNKALDMACGCYICFMDPDDKYPYNDVLDKLCAAARDSDCDIVGGNLRFMAEDGKILKDEDYGYKGEMKFSETQQQYGYQCYLFKRDLIERNLIRFPLLRRRQDPPFFVRCLLSAKSFWGIKDVVYSYRLRNSENRIDWMANNGIRLKDNLAGLELVGGMAKENKLWRLYVNNFCCLSDCGAFSTTAEANIVLKQLKSFVRRSVSSGKVPWTIIVMQATRMFSREPYRIKRFLFIARIFGLVVALRILLRIVKRKVSSICGC